MRHWFDKNNYHEGNAVKLLQSGKEFFSELETVILSAEKFIHIQLYIFDSDRTGNRIIELLKNASLKGVKIFVVVDAYGSQDLAEAKINEMRNAGIHFKKFSPFHRSLKLRFGRRLHHKIILVDGTTALIGGINIAKKYEGDERHTAWLDFAIKLEGIVCNDILKVCGDGWGKRIKKHFKNEFHSQIPYENKKEPVQVRLLQNDWVRRNIEISRFYRQSIKRSEHSLFIVASYFLPGNRMRSLLKRAAQRGVKITFLLSGESDIGFMKQATNYLYPFLLRHDIEIYEWKPSVLHGKLMIVDEKQATIGSYNMNALSDYGSLELNVCVDDAEFAKSVEMRLSKLVTDGCKKINKEDFNKQHYWWNQMINWISYQLLRILFIIFFLFMRK